jgi:hypothetical protein
LGVTRPNRTAACAGSHYKWLVGVPQRGRERLRTHPSGFGTRCHVAIETETIAPVGAARRRHRLRRSKTAQMASRPPHYPAHSGVGQVGTVRWDVQQSRLCFHHERNIYIPPGGAELTSTGNVDQGHIVYYRANKNDCSVCSLNLLDNAKPKCTTAVVHKVTREIGTIARECGCSRRRRGDV